MKVNCRFIPTYVGHTAPTTATQPLSPVHPHIRGAYRLGQEIRWMPTGSSPHTWGIRENKGGGVMPSRFIPTYVGHTYMEGNYIRHMPVHPHIRGAYDNHNEHSLSADGSSPHTWGIRYIYNSVPTLTTVHPHIRGAYMCPPSPLPVHTGSSPHTWGIQRRCLFLRRKRRFIPTYVGHT